jgi:hypothetical protein
MHFFLLFAIAIIIIIPAIIFFTLGLVNKNKKQWLPATGGIILSFVVFFIGIYQIFTFAQKVTKYTREHSKQNMLFTDSVFNSSNTQYSYNNFDIEDAEQYPAFMLNKGERYFFHIYLYQNLTEKMDIMEVTEKEISIDKEIQIIMQFESDFKGELHLVCYDKDDIVIHTSNTSVIECKEDDNTTISFPINENFDLEEIEYCLIK